MMKRASKRRKTSLAERVVEEMVPVRCCICSKKYTRKHLHELCTTIEMADGSASCTIASVIEEVAAVKLKQVAAQAICEICWRDVNAAYLIQDKIRRSKHLLVFNEIEQENDNDQQQGDAAHSPATSANASTEIDVKFEVLVDESSNKRPNHVSEEEYDCEYLDEYLEPSRSDDHTYDSRRDEDEEATIPQDPASMPSLLDASILKEETLQSEPFSSDHRTTRLFEMPRETFVLRNELHDQYRTVEVTGERCCGCSFVAANRRELLQHSESVHAIEITGSGDYCPICFFKFATDGQLERHMQEFKSTTMYVCLQCNRFYNVRQKLYIHLLKCGENNGEVSQNESDDEVEEIEDDTYEVEDYDQIIEDPFNGAECDSKPSANDSLTEAYLRKMQHYRTRFDEIVSNEIFSCELNEAELNVQESQIAEQYTFETFKYVRLRGERCCGCSFISYTREQLMQHGKAFHHAAGRQVDDDHKCILCGSQFQEEREIVKHLSFFTSKELFFCTICNETFLNKENLKSHQQRSERHRERQMDKFQQAGIEMIGQVTFVELDQTDVLEQMERVQAEKNNLRPKSIRIIPMPEARFIKSVVEHSNYCVLTVFGQRCCGCGKFFDTPADLQEHSRHEHTLPLGTNWISDHLQCEICHAVFDFERGLSLHRATRRCNRANLYLCKLCGLLFSKKYCLARHMQSAPNHLSQLIVDAGNNGRKNETGDGEQPGLPEGEANNSAASDPRVSEALHLHKSVQEAGLQKVGHFVGYHCCFSKCTHTFTDEEQLIEHSREEHGGKRRQNECERSSEQNICPCCCKSFLDRGKLSWHRFQRFVPRQHNCKYCDQSFAKWPKLQLHVETEHRASPPNLNCAVCGKSFVLRTRLKAHMKLHDAKKDFTCTICGDQFASNGLMKRHRRSVHSTELLFECKLCPKRFAVIEKLQIHQRVHTGEKPFECTYCPRAFSHYTDRKRHEMAAHTGERPHKCPHCSASYIRKRELSLHMQKHKEGTQN
uniref:C2H2-type domain-containing protein n=1 Tax=Anopheles atroparvus TaxID=41427 RepID=A0AAG5CVF2_ANOAO